MKVKLNQPATHKGKRYEKGDTLTVNARLGGAWIQTGKANVFSKKSVRTSKRKSSNSGGGETKPTGKDSKADDE